MAEQISVLEIKGTEKLKKALEDLLAKADRNTPIILAQAGQIGVGFCKIECPVDLGHLRASIGNPTEEGIFDVTRNAVAFGTAVDYAFPVEFGSRPHIIKPKTKKALRWKDKSTNEYIFAKKVKHPGTKGRHFMLKGIQNAVPGIIKVLKGILRG